MPSAFLMEFKEFEMESLVPDDDKFDWQKPFHEALVEPEPDKLKGKVAEAEAAIFLRFQELAQSSNGAAEKQALQDASQLLLSLKREVLKFPDWKPE
jgi:hypothetical protein